MGVRSSFRKGLRWNVGNGENISFWYENWGFNHLIADVCLVVSGTGKIKVRSFTNRRQWDKSLLV